MALLGMLFGCLALSFCHSYVIMPFFGISVRQAEFSRDEATDKCELVIGKASNSRHSLVNYFVGLWLDSSGRFVTCTVLLVGFARIFHLLLCPPTVLRSPNDWRH